MAILGMKDVIAAVAPAFNLRTQECEAEGFQIWAKVKVEVSLADSSTTLKKKHKRNIENRRK